MSRPTARLLAPAAALALALLGPAAGAGADPVPSGSPIGPSPAASSSAPSAVGAPTAPTVVPDLGITPVGESATLRRGGENFLAYFVGGGPSTGATVELTVPAGFTVSSPTVGADPATCVQTGRHAECDLGPIGTDETLFGFQLTPPASAPIGSSASVTATVAAVEGADPDPGDNTSEQRFPVVGRSDLQTVVSPASLSIVGSAPAVLHVAVSNAGPDPATGVLVTVRRNGDTVIGTVSGAGSVSVSAGTTQVAIGTIAAGATAGIDVRVGAVVPGTPGSGDRSVSVTVRGDNDPGTCEDTESCELLTPVTVTAVPATNGAVATTPATPQLANTGSRDLASGGIGLALVVAGSGLLLAGRRRPA